ncbi:MAG: hypothetical protein AB8H03_12570 [Saprospiraceae bacterium]
MTLVNTLKLIVFSFCFVGLVSCGSKASSSNKTDTKVATVNSGTSKTTTPTSKPTSSSKKVTISGKDMTVKSGEGFCVDVQVFNFIEVISMQYSTNFDSKVLEFIEVKNPALKDLSAKLNGVNFARAKGEVNTLRFSWFVQDLKGISLYDGSTIYQVCFKAIGKSGTVTEVDFAEKPMAGEIGNSKYQPMSAEFGAAMISIE